MRLVELSPRWVVKEGRRVGVSFLCPHCKDDRLHVFFANPADGGPPAGHPAWDRTGASFDEMTLRPSLDASSSGHWHGFLTRGEVS